MKWQFRIQHFFSILALVFFQAISFAQETGGNNNGGGTTTTNSSTTRTTTTETQTWYTEPWVWVVGAAIFIILIVALTRGNNNTSSRTDRVTVTKERGV